MIRPQQALLAEWWIERLRRLISAGAGGFGCQEPHLVPAPIWRQVISAVRGSFPACRFLVWTPGLTWKQVAELRDCGFDAAFSSVAWWDGRAPWFVEEIELLRGIGSVIGSAEAPFGPRLARKLETRGRRRAAYRHMAIRAAATSDGLLIPMGFEFAAEHDMNRHRGDPDDLGDTQAPCTSTLAADIKHANALAENLAKLGLTGATRMLADPGQRDDHAPSLRLPRYSPRAKRRRRDHQPGPAARCIPSSVAAPLPPAAGAALTTHQVVYAETDEPDLLSAGEIRVIHAQAVEPMHLAPPQIPPERVAKLRRVVIENVSPAVDGGRFAAKRVIGEAVAITADAFTDGHELLAVETAVARR